MGVLHALLRQYLAGRDCAAKIVLRGTSDVIHVYRGRPAGSYEAHTLGSMLTQGTMLVLGQQ